MMGVTLGDDKGTTMFFWLRPSQWRSRATPGWAQLTLAAAGATPVMLIGLSTFGWLDLRSLVASVLLPMMAAAAVILWAFPETRWLAVWAFVWGPLATLLYDLFRWSFVISGRVGPDPIPHIGAALGLEPEWFFGYLWRFIGNGGGLALVFVTLGGRGLRAGIEHGLLICSGLLGVLVVSPHAQDVLFRLNPTTSFMAIGGHIIYGAGLGWFSIRRPPPSRPSARSTQISRGGDSMAVRRRSVPHRSAATCASPGDVDWSE
jgi:hypothetical protein